MQPGVAFQTVLQISLCQASCVADRTTFSLHEGCKLPFRFKRRQGRQSCVSQLHASTSNILRNDVSSSFKIQALSLEDRTGCMSVAHIRCLSFQPEFEENLNSMQYIDRRFQLFSAIKTRMEKGATTLVGSVPGPLPASFLHHIAAHPQLQTNDDVAFLERLADFKAAQSQHGSDSKHDRELAELESEWQETTSSRREILGAIDCSTHEFDLCPTWISTFGDSTAYLSDLAVHRSFRRLGVGGKLFRAAVEYLEQDYSDLFLHVDATNPAIALYQQCGFEQVPDCPATLDLYTALALDEGPLNLLFRKSC